jgi:hypothetical protein
LAVSILKKNRPKEGKIIIELKKVWFSDEKTMKIRYFLGKCERIDTYFVRGINLNVVYEIFIMLKQSRQCLHAG